MNFSRLNAILNWSARVGYLFGIPIYVHISLIFFLWPAFAGWSVGPWYALEYAAAIVLSILLHELGHALAAKYYGLTRLSITLHGFGGFAVSSGNRTPTQDLVISLAGPAVTFAIGFLALGIGKWGITGAGSEGAFMQFWLVRAVGSLNLLMGVLNLLPSLPFDGGQAVRALFSRKMSEFKATRAVGHLGLVVSPILLLYGLAIGQSFVAIFGLMGLITSVTTLLNTGGINLREPFADRRARKEMEAVRQRERAKTEAYLNDVRDREKQRAEREKLRKLLESSIEDDKR